MNKKLFIKNFQSFVKELESYVSNENLQWKIKGFIDTDKTIFPISNDTKLVSKIIELHIFPQIYKFAEENDFTLELPSSQNYYPDLTFIDKKDSNIKYAIDIKTTFIRDTKKYYCDFTLGSHGAYFTDRTSKKNIQYPYQEYKDHFVLGIVYKQANIKANETATYQLSDLERINSTIHSLKFFFIEKWKIASDKQGSGNTANIGGILFKESDMLNGNGIFKNKSEFDEYWMNYGKIKTQNSDGSYKTIKRLSDFRNFKKGNNKKL